jgi:hypothetical protein
MRQPSPFDRLSESRSPSVFSALSDNSSRTSVEDDEPDTYNCTLEVKSGLIKAKLVCPANHMACAQMLTCAIVISSAYEHNHLPYKVHERQSTKTSEQYYGRG